MVEPSNEIPFIISKKEMYAWNYIKDQKFSKLYNYKNREHKHRAFTLFPRKVGPMNETGALIVENKNMRNGSVDLNAAYLKLEELRKITHTSKIKYQNVISIPKFFEDLRTNMSFVIQDLSILNDFIYFPNTDYDSIRVKFEKKYIPKNGKSNRILVIFLFNKEVTDQEKQNIDQTLNHFLNFGLKNIPSMKFQNYPQPNAYPALLNPGGQGQPRDPYVHNSAQKLVPNYPQASKNLIQSYFLKQKDLIVHIPSDFPSSIYEKIMDELFSSNMLSVLYTLSQFSITEGMNRNNESGYEVKTTENNYNVFTRRLIQTFKSLTIEILSFEMDQSAPDLKEKLLIERVLKQLEEPIDSRNLKEKGFLVHFSSIKPISGSGRSKLNKVEVYVIFSCDHFNFYATRKNNIGKDSISMELKDLISSTVSSLKFFEFDIDKSIISQKSSFFNTNILELESTKYIFGTEREIQPHIEIIKMIEERSHQKSYKLDEYEYFILKTGDFRLFHAKGLKINFIPPKTMECSGKMKSISEFEGYYRNYLNDMKSKVLMVKINVENEKDISFWDNKGEKVKGKLIPKFNGYLFSDESLRKSASSQLVIKLKEYSTYIHIIQDDICAQKAECLIVPISRNFLKDGMEFTRGVCNSVTRAAGPSFIRELQDINTTNLGEKVFITSPHGLKKNYSKIILAETPVNRAGPFYNNQYSKEIETLFEAILEKIWVNQESTNEADLVTPLFSTGVHSLDIRTSFSSMMNGLVNYSKKKSQKMKNIYIVENEKDKISELCSFIKETLTEKNNKKLLENYIWSWFDQKFHPYDEEQNSLLNKAFNNQENKIKIYFAPHRSPGTHRFDLRNMTVTDLARSQDVKKINRDKTKGVWGIIEGVKIRNYDQKITEILETNFTTNNLLFDLFLKYYEVDFENMTQENVETGFVRQIKREKNELPKNKSETDFNSWGIHVEQNWKKNESLRSISIVFTSDNDTRDFRKAYKEYYTKFIDKKNSDILGAVSGDKIVTSTLLERDKKTWKFVEDEMKKSIPSAIIHKIFKIENNWQKIEFEKERIKIRCTNAYFLWHGTNDPEKLINDDVGFRINYANDGLYGRGLYFAEKAIYSHSYSFKKTNNRKIIFLCKVMLGKSVDMATPEKNLRVCPEGYDSIKGTSNGNIIYIIYEHGRAYPEYMIEYEA